MNKSTILLGVITVGAAIAVGAASRDHHWPTVLAQAPAASPQPPQATRAPQSSPPSGFYLGEAELNPSERAGREIWYKATAGNSRFHTYTFQQRIGVLIDWYRVLNAKQRDDRFAAWGLINDPDCCVPGSEGCPAKSLDDTYGLDYCPGDEALLSFVGKPGYRDPACDFKEAPVDANDIHHKSGDQRQSSCDLAFGTSTGALGFRKFPNPRFDRARWLKINGSPASWEGMRARVAADPNNADSNVSRLADGSIEPPFLIGISCGSCHIAFDPLNPPKDPAHPKWESIKGGIGNQYTRISEILVSGMPVNSLEFQVFAHARPGTSDTSAVPTDQINNPGTINAIMHVDRRPVFAGEVVNKWRKANACAQDAAPGTCWCEPGRTGKCWERSTKGETVHHILKGGEDSIGAVEAIQRVYFNIGSCSEQCWVNHLTDLRQIDPEGRGFGQTPFNIGQCRRDCTNFRAIEDRLPNLLDFLRSRETDATDLAVARQNALRERNQQAVYTQKELELDLERDFGRDAIGRGRVVFAENCARCHSSIPEAAGGAFKNRDFRAVGSDHPRRLRRDWMGNDQATLVSEVGTFRCRALHSNHMTGHIFGEYASDTLHARASDPNLKEPHDGGRGSYRNISLLSLWAHAPFMHNNAMGPELCGKPREQANDFYRSPYVDASTKTLLPTDKAPGCWVYDPSVEGRYKLYVASMQELLNPKQRIPKITKFSQDVPITLGPRLWDGREERQVIGFTLTLPAGTNAGALGNFQHKLFTNDLVLAKLKPEVLEGKLVKQLGPDEGKKVAAELREIGTEALKDPSRMVQTMKEHPRLLEIYSSCTATIENDGHRFGEDLPDVDKKALIAFLATL
jgi:hypothetical protein